MLEVETARALITTSLTDEQLADVIAREEAWLAARIGPLEGERVSLFGTVTGDETLRLLRPAEAITVEDDSGELAGWSYRRWSDIVIWPDHSWRGEVHVTWSPADGPEVERALITLVRLTINESAYTSQSAAGYSANVDPDAQARTRYRTWRSLLRPPQPFSARIASSLPGVADGTLAPITTTLSGS